MNSLVGQTLGNYRLISLLGTGSTGQVYRGQHIQTNRSVAVKVLHPETAASLRHRLGQELMAVSALDHPNIVKLIEFGEMQGHYTMVLEYVPDGSLRNLLQGRTGQPRGPLTRELGLIYQTTQGLAYAHQRGLPHCDIKPDNLMLCREGSWYTLKLSDFGLAHLAQKGAMTATGILLGAPAYVSPEQCQGLDATPQSDIYSLGVVLYELSTGYLPFDANTPTEAVYKHVHTDPVPPRLVRKDLPERLERIILQCLAKSPGSRFASAEALGRALLDLDPGVKGEKARSSGPPAGAGDVTVVQLPSGPAVTEQKQPARSTSVPVVRVLDKSGQQVKTIDLDREVSVGRDPENDLVLSAGVVSLRHALLAWDGSRATVTDLRSSNGTQLDGTRLLPNAPQIWAPHQVLQIGPYLLHIEYQEPVSEDKTVIPGATPQPQRSRPEATIVAMSPPEIIQAKAPEAAKASAPVVRVLDKSGQQVKTIDLDREVSVGRDPENDLVLSAGVVSLRHALLAWDGSRATVTDLRSSNGTQLDGTRLLPNAPQIWAPHQVLQIGPYLLHIEYEEQRVAEPEPSLHPVTESDRIGVVLEHATLSLTPGQPIAMRVTLANMGKTVDHFSLTVEGVPPEWVKGPQQAPQLYPGAQAVVPLTVMAPRDSSSRAGVYAVVIRAHSKDRAWESGSAAASWTVLPFEAGNLTLTPNRARGRERARFQVAVQNAGNTPVAFEIGGEDDEQALRFDFDKSQFSVDPGETSLINLFARAPRRWFGTANTLNFKVYATPIGHAATRTANAQFIHQAIIPPWLPPVAIAVILALAFLLFRIITQPPTIQNVAIEPTSPVAGESVTIRWDVTDAEEVVFMPLGQVVDASLGAFTFTEGFTDPITLTLVARNRFNKTAEKPLPIAVTPLPPDTPIIEEWAISATRVTQGQPVRLRWRVSRAENVTIQPFGTESIEGEREDAPLQNKTYTLIARNGDQIVQRSLEVAVDAPKASPPRITRFAVEPASMLENERETVRLTWETTGAASISIEPGLGSVGPKGSRDVPSPNATTTYELLAQNEGGEKTAQATLEIRDPMRGVFAVKGVSASVTPNTSNTCPAAFSFFGSITANGAGTVTYVWERSDGAEPVVQRVEFEEPGSKTVRSTWTVGAPEVQMSGWQQLKVLTPTAMSSDPAAFTLSCPDAGAADLGEQCINFDPNKLNVVQVRDARGNPAWALNDGAIRVRTFGSEAAARQAVRVFQHYGISSDCALGKPDPVIEYYLTAGRSPSGSLDGERCMSFNPDRLRIRNEKRWIILDGKRWFLLDGDRRIKTFVNQNTAQKAMAVIRKYGFTQSCSVGNEEYMMTYYRR